MTGRLEGKNAIVTGAGSGMGKAIAERFAREGAKVICADISGHQDAVAAAIGPAAIAVTADVADEAQVQHMIDTARDRFGRLDILINNAGYSGPLLPLHEQSAQAWRTVQEINLQGVFFGMKYGVCAMLETGGGAIVNIASASAVVGWKHHSIYGAAKAGVVQLTKAAALDYATHNIRVNAILPGTTWTGQVAASKTSAEPPEGGARVAGIPMDRWGLASEIANGTLFLASDEASYVTGALLPVDGGYSIGFSGMGAEHTGAPTAA